MTDTTPATQPTLTPARKRLIRIAYRDLGPHDALDHLRGFPSFAGVRPMVIRAWAIRMGAFPRPKPTPPAVTQATPTPAAPSPDPGMTGEWYSALAIAKGLDIGVERVYGWKQFGWLQGGPLYTAENIRAFVRAHPLEVARPLMDRDRTPEQVEGCWLWLVSVLAGSREQGAA